MGGLEAQLRHPRSTELVGGYIGASREGLKGIMVMPLMECSLSEALHGGTFAPLINSEESKRYVARQVVEALAYLHAANIFQGDLKSRNIMLDARKGSAQIIDFRFSKTKSSFLSSFSLRAGHGTLPYMAPELLAAMG